MRNDKQRVTIRTVADAVGVSTATVSRVFSGQGGAGEDVTQRIFRVASELGYRGNSIARSLRSQRTDTVGLLVPNLLNPFFPALIQAIEVRLQAGGLGLLLADSQGSVGVEAQRIRALLDRRVDSLIISPVDQVESRTAIQEALRSVTVVQVDRQAGNDAAYVGVNHRQSVELALNHMRQLGRTRFAFAGYDAGVSTSEERLRWFLELTKDIDPGASTRILRETVGDADEVPHEWLDRHADGMDAVVTTSDLIAVSMQMALRERGYSVPEDVAIVGFDNTRLAAVAQITSIQQPLDDLAEAVAAKVEGTRLELPTDGFPCTLVIRHSTAGSSADR
ncbi:LacI family DNA-binding transcriptional regulator [Specibacter cremeus]|uniref:LacI family DNA-binding transcriptional regulator n=1 Tax=Specibacter cremeus TaxID=1629051 RepID=UPI000F771C70|nr:LacI family DNA-binding transcriptional regulator [Specibacter cremeus]